MAKGVPEGQPPIGMALHRGRMREDPEEMRMLRRLHQLVKAGLSHRKIAAKLTEEGFRTRRGNPIRNQSITTYRRNKRYQRIEAEAANVEEAAA